MVSSANDVKGIRQLYNKKEIHIRGLQALGVEARQYGSLLVPVLLSEVPMWYQWSVHYWIIKQSNLQGRIMPIWRILLIRTQPRRESCSRHYHWSWSVLEHCKWRSQKRREWTLLQWTQDFDGPYLVLSRMHLVQRLIQSIWQFIEMKWTCMRWLLTRNSATSGNWNQSELNRKKTLF